MLARIRKAMKEREEGFTLIELLVVIIIIGILAAIAIPVFLNQRQKGYDAQAKSDLRNAATAEETYLTDNPTTYTLTLSDLTNVGFKQSATLVNHFGITFSTNAGYCMIAKSSSGKWWAYDSGLGGLQSTPSTSAPSTSTWPAGICAGGIPSVT
jgi:type IV pilus assembly protein PilA